MPRRSLTLAPFVLLLVIAWTVSSAPGSTPALAAAIDTDRDGITDVAESACGGNAENSRIRPERIDDVFAGRNEDGDGQTDEGLPGSAASHDCDGDGYTGLAEQSIFEVAGRDQDACGIDAWPSDFVSGGLSNSTNRITLADLASFVAPERHLNTSPGDLGYNTRWDLSPGPGMSAETINLQDLATMIAGDTGFPSMFGGEKAFAARPCPWPLTSGWSLGTPIPGATYPLMVGLVSIPGRPDEAVVVAQKQEKAYRISLSGAFTPTLFGDLSGVVGGSGGEEGFLALAFPPG
ncbi:MAG TPA: hypothetical protein VFO59_11155, partial [Dehalococcoidia bacterium]|nr:hypothetical protein [Dehalococcoidia bacterium]